ncbi:MAG: hypothetical protein Q7T41_03330 [Candidatus Saccharibacteria bacterium]|nr:hypothetical protein [Candidatus Saccharibacteria bacterium]
MNKSKLFEGTELIVIAVVSLLALILFNIDIFIRFLTGKSTTSYEFFHEKVSELIKVPLTWLSEHLLTASVTTFILWAIVGLVCYSVLYFFLDIKSEVNESAAEEQNYVHPRGENIKLHRSLVLKNSVVLLFSIILLIILLVLTLKYFLPFSSTNIYLSLNDSSSIINRIWLASKAYFSVLLIPVTYLLIVRSSKELRRKINA